MKTRPKGFGGFQKTVTREAQEKRVDLIVKYLRGNPIASRFDLHKKFCKKFNLSWRQVEELSSRARLRIKKESKITTEEAKAIGLGIVSKWLSDVNPIVALKAERAFASIHGYEAPAQTRIGSPDGSPLPQTVVAPIVNFILPKKSSKSE